MKKLFIISFLIIPFSNLDAQTTLYTPSGTVNQSNNSNVGIGTSSPLSQLHLKDASGGSFLQFTRGTGNARFMMENNLDKLFIVTGENSETQGIVIDESGKIGIGNRFPDFQLHLKDASGGGFLQFTRGTGNARFMMENNLDKLFIVTGENSETQGIVIDEIGKVGIGTRTPDSKLTVKGNIHTQEVKVDLNGAIAPDFVFEENYPLKSLSETEQYIKTNKHLPEIPSALEMEENGFELKEMNLKLLQKIEELTLHLIEQNKELKAQKEQNQVQQTQIEQLEKKLTRIEKQ